MVIVFITADIEGCHILSHKLPITPIYEILKSQGYDCAWGIWRSPWGRCPPFKSEDIQCYVTGDTGIPTSELRSKTFFHTHGLHPFEQGYHNPYLWYGCLAPGKYFTLYQKYNIINRHAEVIPPEIEFDKMPITGWAKLDILFKKNKNEVISEYNLTLPYEKTVLYAPAGNWDYASSFDKSIEHILNIFSRLPYNLIIKNAVYSSSFKKWDYFENFFKNNHPNHINRISKAPLDGANIDITPLYLVSDLMITDGSSVAWEFIGTDKPAIQLNNMPDPKTSLMSGPCGGYCEIENERGLRYKKSYGASIIENDYEECKACGGTIKSSLQDLENTIIEGIENPDLYGNQRRKWAKITNQYVDGKCAQRCVDEIKRIAEI